jgi:hypothetical protein
VPSFNPEIREDGAKERFQRITEAYEALKVGGEHSTISAGFAVIALHFEII